MIADSNIDNNHKKRPQQNNGKVHLKGSTNKPSSAEKKVAIIGDSMVKNIKALPSEQIKIVKVSTGLCQELP